MTHTSCQILQCMDAVPRKLVVTALGTVELLKEGAKLLIPADSDSMDYFGHSAVMYASYSQDSSPLQCCTLLLLTMYP